MRKDNSYSRSQCMLIALLSILLGLSIMLIGCSSTMTNTPHVLLPSTSDVPSEQNTTQSVSGSGTELATATNNPAGYPSYEGMAYVSIASKPDFTEDDKKPEAFEYYSPLDDLGRCGVTYACVCLDTMPTEARESISKVKPSGWVNKKYEFVDGGYVYNRCHLIGFQLTAENANELNLITGTRYLNIEGMLPFENMVADYVKETENHVLYRVTPVYDGGNLVASGVQMEGWSIEDEGEGICFNVYCYNVQPGVEIDYASGDNWIAGEKGNANANPDAAVSEYVLNTKTMKFHLSNCSGAADISDANRQNYSGSRGELIEEGYEPCGRCKP